MLMIGGGANSKGRPKPMQLRVLVANADEVYQRALEEGAVSTLAMTEAYGERFRPPALLKQRVRAGLVGGRGKRGWRSQG